MKRAGGVDKAIDFMEFYNVGYDQFDHQVLLQYLVYMLYYYMVRGTYTYISIVFSSNHVKLFKKTLLFNYSVFIYST